MGRQYTQNVKVIEKTYFKKPYEMEVYENTLMYSYFKYVKIRIFKNITFMALKEYKLSIAHLKYTSQLVFKLKYYHA